MSTPIYDQLKTERQIEAIADFANGARAAFQSIIDAFRPFIEYITAIAKTMQRYDMSSGQPIRNPNMKPLIHKGGKP